MGKEVVDIAKKHINVDADEVRIGGGVRVNIVPVSSQLLQEVISSIPEPKVPLWHDPDRGKEIENPGDPEYLRKVEEQNEKRGIAIMEALVMFGVELLDGVPEDETWVKRLKFLEKRGRIDLSMYDFDDPTEREFLYKNHIAVTAPDMELLQKASGVITEEALAKAEGSFPSDEERSPDPAPEAEER